MHERSHVVLLQLTSRVPGFMPFGKSILVANRKIGPLVGQSTQEVTQRPLLPVLILCNADQKEISPSAPSLTSSIPISGSVPFNGNKPTGKLTNLWSEPQFDRPRSQSVRRPARNCSAWGIGGTKCCWRWCEDLPRRRGRGATCDCPNGDVTQNRGKTQEEKLPSGLG